MAITISVSGDENFRTGLKKLAHRHEKSLASLLREIIDESKYADELNTIIANFFANGDTQIYHNGSNGNHEAQQS